MNNMEPKDKKLLSRRQFFKRTAYASLPMLGLVMSGCDTFQSALMNSVSNMGSGGSYSRGSGSYDDGGSYGCGNLCTFTCSKLCTDTCKNLCTTTCYHSSV